MLPPPITTATCTPRSTTRLICMAIAAIRSRSAPYSSGPIRASPDRFSSTSRNAGRRPGSPRSAPLSPSRIPPPLAPRSCRLRGCSSGRCPRRRSVRRASGRSLGPSGAGPPWPCRGRRPPPPALACYPSSPRPSGRGASSRRRRGYPPSAGLLAGGGFRLRGGRARLRLLAGRSLVRAGGGRLAALGGRSGFLRLATGLLLGLDPGSLLGLDPGSLLGLPALLLLALASRPLLLGAELGVLLRHDVADRVDDQLARADRVVVARDDVVDGTRVAVGVDEADDRDLQPGRLAHRDVLGLQVDHDHGVRGALHLLHAAQVHLELVALALRRDPLARRKELKRAVLGPIQEVVEALDPLRDRLEVREQPAEPALVHVGHAGLLGGLLDGVAGLLLGAHEHDRPAAAGEVRGELLRVTQQSLGLLQVDDVNPLALAEDEAAHLRVPAPGLVPEVDSRLEQVRDRDLFHTAPFFVSDCARGNRTDPAPVAGRARTPAPRGRMICGAKDTRGGRKPPEKRRGGPKTAPAPFCSAPVWPFGGWLPCSRLERGQQVHGQVGLAGEEFPAIGMPKQQTGAVEKLARKPKTLAAGPPAVLGIAADGVPDGREMDADLVRPAGLEADTEQGRARKATLDLEVGARGAGLVGADRLLGPQAPVAAQRRVDRAGPRPGPPLDERQVLAPDLARPEQVLEDAVHPVRLGDDQEAGGVAVEPVHDPRAPGVRPAGPPPRQRAGQRAAAVARGRVYDHAGGLVDHEQAVVLVHDVERNVLVGGPRRLRIHKR